MSERSNVTAANATSANRGARTPSTTSNVITNWLWYVLVLASGFVIPRLISDRLGKEQLGAWDLGWTFVFFVRWLQLGVTSSVNRFIAHSRARDDLDDLNAVFNTSLALLSTACLLGGIAATAFYWIVPQFLADSSPELIEQARVVVLLLSLTAALQLPGGVFNAVITGYERFDLLNAIRIARDGAVLVAIGVVLFKGGTLVQAAWAYLIGEVLGDAAKVVVARKVCPMLSFSPKYYRWKTLKTLLAYGSKTVAQGLARGSLYDVNRLLVTWYLGGAEALAVYSRQGALLKHALRFMKQYAQVFIPRSSALDAGNDRKALGRLLVGTSKYGLYTTLPMIALFCIMGDIIVRIWMGPGYERHLVLAIIALGHALLVPQQGVYSVLLGMNRHGRIAIFDWIGVALSFGLGWLLMVPAKMGMIGAAIALATPMMLTGGLLMPIYACRLLDVSPTRYFRDILTGPTLAALPFAATLAISRLLIQSDIVALSVGLLAGGLVTLPIYWRVVLPKQLRERIVARLLSRKTNAGPEPTTVSGPPHVAHRNT
ncbi:MAG: polysaccharide biosynthesis protein [Phycisphaerales bacterium]|nr:polysaccharide biosynthesis protein [Phycisphaerales bacterium]MCB9856515.1 polysaccharide biosynthesis protein [Phycisphaerales bacterium]MCB9863996.1 polysaccharide biosynthesis protein [Phycisphaerales bacterium]